MSIHVYTKPQWSVFELARDKNAGKVQKIIREELGRPGELKELDKYQCQRVKRGIQSLDKQKDSDAEEIQIQKK